MVQSVTRAGTYVEVMYRKKTGSKELGREADNVVLLDIKSLVDWTKIEQGDNRRDHFPFINFFNGGPNKICYEPCGPEGLIKKGTVNYGKTINIIKLSYHKDNKEYVISVIPKEGYIFDYYFKDKILLEKFVTEQHGLITW